MKVTKQQYKMFVKECRYWIDKLELNNWNYAFEFKKLEDATAQTRLELTGLTVTIALCTDLETFDYEISSNDYIKQCAKHEVIHVLVGRLAENARARFLTNNDWYESVEELVTKLTKIIKD